MNKWKIIITAEGEGKVCKGITLGTRGVDDKDRDKHIVGILESVKKNHVKKWHMGHHTGTSREAK